MTPPTLRLGLIDGGASPRWQQQLAAHQRFGAASLQLASPPAPLAATRHADEMLELIRHGCPDAALHLAVALDGRLRARSDDVARAVHWLVDSGVQLIHMSLGMARPCTALQAACARATAQGCLLVASSPAQGMPVWPASDPQVVAVTGDLRCRPDEIAWLDAPHARFGAHPFLDFGRAPRRGGASHAAARFTGRLAGLLHAGLSGEEALSACERAAAWHGQGGRHARAG